MTNHIYTREECKKLIEELEIISYTEKRTDVNKKNITPILMQSILFHTIKCRDKLSERIYWIINDIEDYFNCKECGKYIKPRFYGIGSNYSKHKFCSGSCSTKNKDTQTKMQSACQQRYGYKNVGQSPEIRAKVEATCEEKYGYRNVLSSPEIREKCSQTCEEKYGYRNPQQSPEIQEKTKLTCLKNHNVEYALQSPVIREKFEQTCVERFGQKNPMQNLEIQTKAQNTHEERHGYKNPQQCPKIRAKTEATCEEKYGYKNVFSSPEIQEKIQATCEEKYGYKNVWCSPEIRKQIDETNLQRYNAKNVMHNLDIFLKSQKNSNTFKLKTLILPSGTQVTYQGYEDIVILKLLENEYLEEQIIIDNKLIPIFKYIFGNKGRIYYPDLYIPHENLIIEVKSTYTYEKELSKNLAKRQACLDAGYNFEFWICSDKEVLEII